jgi:hypothetical protein
LADCGSSLAASVNGGDDLYLCAVAIADISSCAETADSSESPSGASASSSSLTGGPEVYLKRI